MGAVGVNRKWSGISLGVIKMGCVKSGRQPEVAWESKWGSCQNVWESTGSGLGLVWGSCGVCGSQPEVVCNVGCVGKWPEVKMAD